VKLIEFGSFGVYQKSLRVGDHRANVAVVKNATLEPTLRRLFRRSCLTMIDRIAQEKPSGPHQFAKRNPRATYAPGAWS
jgi:hypothetical protein